MSEIEGMLESLDEICRAQEGEENPSVDLALAWTEDLIAAVRLLIEENNEALTNYRERLEIHKLNEQLARTEGTSRVFEIGREMSEALFDIANSGLFADGETVVLDVPSLVSRIQCKLDELNSAKGHARAMREMALHEEIRADKARREVVRLQVENGELRNAVRDARTAAAAEPSRKGGKGNE